MLAEDYYSLSQYSYVANNPISSIDPDGMSIGAIASSFVTPDGTLIEHRKDGDPTVYLVTDIEVWRDNGSKKEDAERVGYEWPGVNYSSKVGQKVVYYPSKDPVMPGYLKDGPLEESYIIEEIIATLSGGKVIWGMIRSPQTLSRLLMKCYKGRSTKGPTELWYRYGGYKQAKKDFRSFHPSNVKTVRTAKGELLTGKTSDGKTITVREWSSENNLPTLEFRNANGRGVEIRYK